MASVSIISPDAIVSAAEMGWTGSEEIPFDGLVVSGVSRERRSPRTMRFPSWMLSFISSLFTPGSSNVAVMCGEAGSSQISILGVNMPLKVEEGRRTRRNRLSLRASKAARLKERKRCTSSLG